MSDPSSRDDRLGEILRRAVPEGPEPIGRAEAVVGRGRAANRRRSAGAVLGVGVVALAVVVGPNLLDGGPSKRPEAHPGPGPTTGNPSAVTGNAHPHTCPTAGEHQRRTTLPPSDDVPAGAVLARICPVHAENQSPWNPPADALTTHVGAVARAYNYLPNGEPQLCRRTDRSLGFSVTFEYPDGHLVRVSADTNGYGSCDFISVVGRDDLGRARSAVVMRTYFEALQRQSPREVPPPTLHRTPLHCPVSSAQALHTPLAGTHLDLSSVTICHYPGLIQRTRSEHALIRAEVSHVNADYASAISARPPLVRCSLGPSDPVYLLGADDWGGQVWLALGCGYFQGHDHYWLPGRDVRAILSSS